MVTRATILALVLVTGCGGRSPRPDPQTPAEGRSAGQQPATAGVPRRVILYEARSGNVMILVNRGHPWRKTRKGRLRLVLNRNGQGYKVLSAKEMDALLVSFERYAFARYSSTFERGDEQYLTSGTLDTRYRGILYVESGNERRKVLSFRPSGASDVDGHERLRNFIDLKAIFYRWYNTHSETEMPQQGVGAGSSS